MARATFDPNADQSPRDSGPARMRYACKAHQCPMPGAVDGLCGWHYRETPNEWGQITGILKNWECVTVAINAARRVVTDPVLCVDPKGQREALREEWARLVASLTGNGYGWKARLEPVAGETIGDWGRRLEVFLGARVKSDLTGHACDERIPTPTVAEMRQGLRDKPLGAEENGP